jgi:tetratricopeptide (TPR) repeat protein
VRPADVRFAARDFILVTAFDNRTGETLFDSTVEYALERELSNSTFVNVVPRPRVNDTLVLMRKPVETRVDAEIGREVALRDGNVAVLLAGRVERFGSHYVLTADIVRTGDGGIAASVREEAAGEDAVLAAIRRVADDVRRRLGENLEAVQAKVPPLPRVTTTSLRALQLFAQAEDAIGANEAAPINRAAAEQLLREAIAIDREFAQAHLSLANVAGDPRPETRAAMWPFVERALAAAKHVPETERLLIEAQAHIFRSRYLVADDGAARQEARKRAVACLEAVLRIQPDHLAALDWLRSTTQFFADGRGRAREVAVRHAQLRPTSLSAQINAARISMDHGDVGSARRYVARARTLDVPPAHVSGALVAWLALFDANEAWLASDVRRALAIADEFASQVQELPAEHQEQAAVSLSMIYLSLGRLRQSEQIVNLGPAWLPEAVRDQHKGRVIALRGDRRALAAFLSDRFRTVEDANFVASNMMDAGLLDMGRKIVAYHRARGNDVFEWYEGQLALAEGHTEEAIRRLAVAAKQFPPMNNQGLKIARQLADAHQAAGRLDRAIQLLEDATRQSSELTHGWEWLRSRDRLAEVYRAAGRVADAAAIDGELATLLAVADDDHFIKQRLAARALPPP